MLAALEGDRRANELHYARALRHAERAGDGLQILRIRTNRGSRLIEEGDHAGAIAELDAALATGAGVPALEALAHNNRGEAALRLGRLEEALADLLAARALFQAAESRFVAYVTTSLADLHAERGETALARLGYEEALRISEAAGDLQGVVPPLAGLAVLLAEEDGERAARLIARALALEPRMGAVCTRLAAARVAAARGDDEAAGRWAAAAAEAARERRDLPGLAEALELGATAGAAPHAAFEQALSLWRTIGDPVGESKAQIALAAATGDHALAAAAAVRLEALGARGHAARARAVAARAPAAVRVECLGIFRVLRAGVPVTRPEWGSRKPRDLLKQLVAHRGRQVARDVLIEALWPDGDPVRCGPRLSVALSTLRGVLDPAHEHAPDAFVAATAHALRLDLSAVEVDVEAFLADPDEALYRGDAFEEDRYEDWSAPVRDEAREAYGALLRRLAAEALERGDHEGAARRFLRLLEQDAYDERAHVGLIGALVAARRHGEARRRHARYVAAMEELGLPAEPLSRR